MIVMNKEIHNKMQKDAERDLKIIKKLIQENKQLKKENKRLKEQNKFLIKDLNELSQYKIDREEEDMMNYLIQEEEKFNDYSFMEED